MSEIESSIDNYQKEFENNQNKNENNQNLIEINKQKKNEINEFIEKKNEIPEKSKVPISEEAKRLKVEIDLDNWKKTEQIKFKAYLRQVEYDYVTKLQNEFKKKEDDREREFKKSK